VVAPDEHSQVGMADVASSLFCICDRRQRQRLPGFADCEYYTTKSTIKKLFISNHPSPWVILLTTEFSLSVLGSTWDIRWRMWPSRNFSYRIPRLFLHFRPVEPKPLCCLARTIRHSIFQRTAPSKSFSNDSHHSLSHPTGYT
jgi:hypothetical protein